MSKILLEVIRPHVKLYRNPRTGIAWVEDGTSGTGHSCHSNIDSSGSVSGMKSRGYWGKNDRTVRSNGWIYNIDRLSVSGELDEIARQHCRCGGVHEDRQTRQRHRLAVTEPHGLCERAKRCLEHAQDPRVEACK